MGSNSINAARPVHSVTIPDFEMMRIEVTVAQYQACVDDGMCSEPKGSGSYFNWGVEGREDHPVNHVTWYQSKEYCAWAGGRLPTEAEWEYAARSKGQDIKYPWGDETATCDYAVMSGVNGMGCGRYSTWPVCSKTAGNTDQGLCDMAGNVWEWVEDDWHYGYTGAPDDGSAWVDEPRASHRASRGGAFSNPSPSHLWAAERSYDEPIRKGGNKGFRCAR